MIRILRIMSVFGIVAGVMMIFLALVTPLSVIVFGLIGVISGTLSVVLLVYSQSKIKEVE